MDDTGSYEERIFSNFRNPTIDTLDLGKKKHHMQLLLEIMRDPFKAKRIMDTVVVTSAITRKILLKLIKTSSGSKVSGVYPSLKRFPEQFALTVVIRLHL
jgi:hypothetical protein